MVTHGYNDIFRNRCARVSKAAVEHFAYCRVTRLEMLKAQKCIVKKPKYIKRNTAKTQIVIDFRARI